MPTQSSRLAIYWFTIQIDDGLKDHFKKLVTHST